MLKIVVPMAGEGKRFAEFGHTFPKPLVEIDGKPMIEAVVSNLTPTTPHQFIFVCRREHVLRFALKEVLQLVAPGCQVVVMHDATAGALCSVLLAMEYLNDESELLIANGDQIVDASIDDFLVTARAPESDGCIMTFPSTHPKWSFVKVMNGEVMTVAEKRPISDTATVGLYYFRRSREFLAGAERSLLKNAAVNGEFYVSPVYNEMVLMGKRITTHGIGRDQMHSLGTPEDVKAFNDMLAAKAMSQLRGARQC
jgi:dTDP-glucose pyrophosphorylase